MIIVLVLLVLAHIYFCWKSLAYGCAFMIAVHMIFPPLVRIGPVSMNTAFIFILFMFCLWQRGKELRKKDFFPIYTLSIPLAILGLFASLSYFFQFKELLQFTITELLPFSLIGISIRNQNDLSLVVKSILIAFFIIGVYGIVTYFIMSNPWVIMWSEYSGYENELFVGDGSEAVRGALSSMTTGNMPGGALPWGQVCLTILIIVSCYPRIENKKIRIILIVLATCNCLLTTKRSIILPMLVPLAILLYYDVRIKQKHIFSGIGLLVVLCFVFTYNQTLHKIYESNIKTAIFFWDDKLAEKNSFGGSSKDMRLEQIVYTNNLISQNIFAGRGFGFTKVFLEKHANTTNARAFESIYLWAIANSGYIGLVFWLMFFYRCYEVNKNIDGYHKTLLMHGCYWLSILLTGIQAPLYYYMILVALFSRYMVLYPQKYPNLKVSSIKAMH